jgi:hypothetical protein
MKINVFLLAALAMASAPVAAEAGKDDSPKGAADKKVCRKIGETGSRLMQRVCLSPADWERYDAGHKTNTDMIKNRNADQNHY